MTEYEKLTDCLAQIRKITDFIPETAIVLGSGLGAFAENVKDAVVVNYSDISGFPVSTVPGHAGKFIFGYINEKPVAVMQGRVHFYEGYDITSCVLPIRLLHLMGAKSLILTNASGGINKSFNAGDFMIIDDHISLFVRNPLIGANIDELGTRFPDMSMVYSKRLRDIAKKAATKLNIPIKNGVYVQLTGPSYESPAEIKMLASLGADAVGMSTVCEAIAARHMGMQILGISCVSNLAAGISPHPLSHDEVQEAMNRAGKQFKELLVRIIKEM